MAHHQLPEYDDQSDNWKAYITKVEAYFEATGVSDSGKKRMLLVAALSTRTVQVLSGQVAPRKPNSLTYEEAVKVLDAYFDPKRHEITESYRFFNRCQLEVAGAVGADDRRYPKRAVKEVSFAEDAEGSCQGSSGPPCLTRDVFQWVPLPETAAKSDQVHGMRGKLKRGIPVRSLRALQSASIAYKMSASSATAWIPRPGYCVVCDDCGMDYTMATAPNTDH
ncbi:hypothetical protein V5799_006617 [Amblyomma americanum]|uniref:Uncharacterized protein n=1 Tax=Amblyomma americanum TaxID=6943 RepID=A0AAQ4DVW2_AMBAM